MIRRPPRSTQSRSSAASDVYKRQPRVERRTGQPLVRLDVLATCRLDHLGGQRWAGRLSIPTRRGGVVADVLLVEARWRAPGLPRPRRPVAGRVRGEDLVGEYEGVVPQPELELRVRQD